jgi:hypothetical protein
MGFFAGIAGTMAASGKAAYKFKSGQSDTSKPFHTHLSSKETSGSTNIGNDPISDVPRPDPSFMGKGQMDDFASLTDPSSVDREGNVIAPAPTALPLAGQTPSDISPEDAFKITPRQDIDEIGMNKLYNT